MMLMVTILWQSSDMQTELPPIHCHDDDDCDVDDVYSDDGDDDSDAFAEQRHANRATSKSQLL